MPLSSRRRLAYEAMIAFAVFSAVLGAAQEPDTKTFKDDTLGLSFQYPAGWQFRQERL